MLARNYMYARLRVQSVQFALLLRMGVVDTFPSLSLMQTWLVTAFVFAYVVCSFFV